MAAHEAPDRWSAPSAETFSSSITGARAPSAPRARARSGCRRRVRRGARRRASRSSNAPKSGRGGPAASRYAPSGLTDRPASISTRACTVTACTRPEAEQGQRRADPRMRNATMPVFWPVVSTPRAAGAVQHERLQQRDDERDRDQRETDRDEEADRSHVHPGRRRQDLAGRAPARDPERRGGTPRRPRDRDEHDQREQREDGAERERSVDELHERRASRARSRCRRSSSRPGRTAVAVGTT